MRRGRSGRALDRVVLGCAAGLLGVAANRALGPRSHRWLIGAQAVSRWLLLPSYPVLLLAVVRRRPVAAGVGAGLAAYQLLLSRPGPRARERERDDPADGPVVRLVSANLLLSNPEVAEAYGCLLEGAVDIVALQELTPEHLAVLRASPLLDRFPHTLVRPEEGYHGAGLLSRWPLAASEVVDLDGVPLPLATVRTPGGDLTVAVVHAKNPGAPGELRRWQRQLDALGRLALGSSAPVVCVGDFNATADHRDFRRLLDVGLRDAWDVAGRGAGATWPVWSAPVPALLRLDHALVGPGVEVLAAEVADTPGSDHRHLRVALRLCPA